MNNLMLTPKYESIMAQYTGETNRMLLKYYRQELGRYNDATRCRDNGSEYYLGDRILSVIYDSSRMLMVYKTILLTRYSAEKLAKLI